MAKMSSKSVILTTVVLFVYFVFTSGMVYELTDCDVTDRLITPYSFALSGERTGLIGLYSDDDLRCAEWVATQSKKYLPVVCDGNTALLLRSYNFVNVEYMTSFEGAFSDDPHYLLYSTWNTESGKAIVNSRSAGMRGVDTTPKIDTALYSEVFISGKAVIYERILPCED